jgi:hypothetical protein
MTINHYIYNVVDIKTGMSVGAYSTRARALRHADKLDNQYGAHRFAVRVIPVMS